MGRRRSSRQTLTMEAQGYGPTLRKETKFHRGRHRPTRRVAGRCPATPPGTNSQCHVITVAPFEKGPSRSEIWYSVGSRVTRTATSCHCRGKVPSSSTKSCALAFTSSRMKKVNPSPTPGTSNSYIASTLKKSSHVPKKWLSSTFLATRHSYHP
jgi:hypothetical protein